MWREEMARDLCTPPPPPPHALTGIGMRQALIADGVAIDSSDAMGLTALHRAVLHARVAAVEKLVLLGACKEQPDVDGRTPIQYAEDAASHSSKRPGPDVRGSGWPCFWVI
jgi:ankyrin repeat protein